MRPLRAVLGRALSLLDPYLAAMRASTNQTLAYDVAVWAHRGQRRRDGTPCVTHPAAVAELVAQLGMPPNMVEAALLHDVLDETALSAAALGRWFASDTVRLVRLCSRLDGQREHALAAMRTDWRVAIIKLADRLDNMRTLSSLAPNRRRAIAVETRDVFVPIAHGLGLSHIKDELGDLAFAHLRPMAYRAISRHARQRRDESLEVRRLIARVVDDDVEVTWRCKAIHSIDDKMRRYGLAHPAEVLDVVAVRVVLVGAEADVSDCYRVFARLQSGLSCVPGTVKDYVAHPKRNGYRSLHTTVLVRDEPVELQIRTLAMHATCEHGAAAHWRYKTPPDMWCLIDELQREYDLVRPPSTTARILLTGEGNLGELVFRVTRVVADHDGELRGIQTERGAPRHTIVCDVAESPRLGSMLATLRQHATVVRVWSSVES